MILYEIFPNKTLKIREDEKTYITENLISSVHIKLPSTFGDYPVKELTAELRFYFPEGDYMAYAVDTQQARPEVPITNDITEKPQTLSVMLFFYKGGNVIGKTNSVDKVILDAPLKGEPLTPRAEFDEVIAEQRETIAEQAETITEQTETISSQGEQITELSNEIEEIRKFLPVHIPARLQSKEVLPSQITKFVIADEGYDGLSSVTVCSINAEQLGFEKKYYAVGKSFLGEQGEYHPFPENSYGGIYFTELNKDNFPVGIKVVNYDYNYNYFSVPALTIDALKTNIKSLILLDCKNVRIQDQYFNGAKSLVICKLGGVLSIGNYAFSACTSLTEINLPDSLTSIGNYAFKNCTSLTELTLPDSLTSMGGGAFENCTSLTNLTLAQGFNCNRLDVHWSTLFTAETIVACLEALADRTGQTAYTITFGTTNLNKLTAEQKAIATNKNWNLA